MAATIHPLPVPSPDLDARFARAWKAAGEADLLAAIRTARALRLTQEAAAAEFQAGVRTARVLRLAEQSGVAIMSASGPLS
jgi:hypothetical protein